MGVTVSIGLQKGGVGKSTACGLTSFILSRQGYRVLAVDLDSQGNLTQLLTHRSPYDFQGRTVLEACKEQNPTSYLYPVDLKLSLLPAEDLLSTFSRWLFDELKPSLLKRGNTNPNALSLVLRSTLDVVKDDFDFILLDLPPNLGEQTLNGLAASDFCVAMVQAEPFSYDALERYLITIEHVREMVNPATRLAGILTTLLDARTTVGNFIHERVREEYQDLVFNTVIRRKARIVEFGIEGIQDRVKGDRDALEAYEQFVEELKQRVQQG